jgi:hypothetical protein
LDGLAANDGGEGAEYPKVDFSCLKGPYPVTLKGMNIFERANDHLTIGVTVLEFNVEHEEGELSDKTGVIYSVRVPSVESVEHWVGLLYEPAIDAESIGHFFPIPDISRALSEGKKQCSRHYCRMCLSRFHTGLKLKHHLIHCKRHGCHSVETVSGNNATMRLKSF